MKTLMILLICLLSFASGAKTFASFKLTVLDRFDKKGINDVKVELFTTGKKSRVLKTGYTNESGIIQFDSLENGSYYYNTVRLDYIEENDYITISNGQSVEQEKILNLTDLHKAQILAPYIITKADVIELEKDTIVCTDSIQNVGPVYMKGFQQFRTDLMDLINYPIKAIEMEIEGKVIVQFIVDEKGIITKVGLLQHIDLSLDLEAMLVVLLLDRFEPAICDGKPIKSLYSIPITFNLN
nr:TonB family protein [uncultured Fluviicola sp.]